MRNAEFQTHVDQSLSRLVWHEEASRQTLGAIEKEENGMRKISIAAILVAALLCISMTALAAGLVFSPRYEAGKAAEMAMEEQYGLTDELLSLFYREIEVHADGSATVTYTAMNTDWPIEQMGAYTVQVSGGQAVAAWSNDGRDTSGGLAAEAFGAEQLQMLSDDYAGTMQQLYAQGTLTETDTAVPAATPLPADIVWTEADQLAADQAVGSVWRTDEERLALIAQVEAVSKLSLQQAEEAARDAVCQAYALDDAQQRSLQLEEGSTWASWEDGQPMVNILLWLWQEESLDQGRNGQYWVTVNMDTGVIEEILYDAGKAGNG